MYGLKTNPFFTEALLLYGGEIEIRAGFVGREDEVKRLQTFIGSRGAGRVLVTGDVGVGKTTLVNYVRALAPPKIFFTPLKEIQTQPEWTGSDFLLNTLSAIHTTFKVKSELTLDNFTPEVRNTLTLLFDIVEKKDKNFSLDILGTGGGYGSSTSVNVPAPTLSSLHIFFEKVIQEIRKMGFQEVILSYNNLEIMDSMQMTRLFQSIREFIQTKDVKFIFIGGLSVNQVISKIPRVQSIMSESPIVLPCLTLREVKDLLAKRIHYLGVSGLQPMELYEDDVISKLYSLYDGNLRFILNSLSEAFNYILRDNPIVLTSEDLIQILPEIAKSRWLNKLTASEREVLFLILHEKETTNKKIAESLHRQRQNISPITNKLIDLCAIRSKMEGKVKFFSVEPSVKWFLLSKSSDEEDVNDKRKKSKQLDEDVQKALSSFKIAI